MALALRLASEVFTHRPSATVNSRRASSPGLLLPSRVRLRRRCHEQGRPCRGCLPCGLSPFGVFPAVSSHLSGGSKPRYVPSQRFSRSQGLAPPTACRPCFVPVPPLGFLPSRADLHSQSRTPSRTPIPSWSWSPTRPICLTSSDDIERQGTSRARRSLNRRGSGTCARPSFRALLPASVRIAAEAG
jgi:hypothetical protein